MANKAPSPATCGKRVAQCIPVILSSFILLVMPAAAQQSRWKNLQSQAEGFLEQRKYKEGLQAAQKALGEAERTFGTEHGRWRRRRCINSCQAG